MLIHQKSDTLKNYLCFFMKQLVLFSFFLKIHRFPPLYVQCALNNVFDSLQPDDVDRDVLTLFWKK